MENVVSFVFASATTLAGVILGNYLNNRRQKKDAESPVAAFCQAIAAEQRALEARYSASVCAANTTSS